MYEIIENGIGTLSRSEQDTIVFAKTFARFLLDGATVVLDGDLGAGKTVFARGIVHGLGVQTDYVTSPTFTLMNPYEQGRLPVYHFDLYRLGDPDELDAIGAEEFLDGSGVALVEWAERGEDRIPEDRLTVSLSHHDDDPTIRTIALTANGSLSRKILDAFLKHNTE
ncbi:MAG: tRNA (adenosine(37)-N6)-threonylcarbamoyltransferase complex ATPase subunit type 1 TsaE [Magnetococcales bacterium]|nr:tRNA (adenosine(37)-N6)-threonylcarbamoyltransferase complex ATPase subunit type 1 TsaE [Magnetococcales bacterium]